MSSVLVFSVSSDIVLELDYQYGVIYLNKSVRFKADPPPTVHITDQSYLHL